MILKNSITTLLVLCSLSSFAESTTISDDLKRYKKCYSQFLSKRLSPSDETARQIQRKEKTGHDSCLKLLERANLDSRGNLKVIDETSKSILRTFNLFHNTWFSLYNFNRESQDHAATNALDSSQMSYHVTRSLFTNKNFSDQFTTTKTLWAKRENSSKNNYSNDKDIIGKRYKLDGSGTRIWQVGGILDDPEMFGDVYPWKPELVEFGDLIGLREVKEHKEFTRLKEGKKKGKSSLTKNIFKGTFGSIPYLVLNLGHDNKTTDGGNVLHRRFSTNFFKDYLCRDLPVLREEDIKVIKNSKITFKKKQNCMSCHQTIDNLSLITRNIEVYNAGEFSSKAFVFRAIEEHRTSANRELPINSETNFHKTNPTGLLNFRSFDGSLINIALNDPNNLGEEIKKLDDPYVCAVKRYFSFLTGIDVQIYDFENFIVKEEQKEYLVTRDFVIKLAKELKEHQSLKSTIYSIIKSPYYIEGS